MMIALNAKNKFRFIDGLIPQPVEADPTYEYWFQNNSVVSSWILNSISEDLIPNVIYSTSAAEMWNVLHDQFHQSNGPRIFQLKSDLIGCIQGILSVSTYFSKIHALWKELQEVTPTTSCVCGGCACKANQQKDHVLSFLMGLNEEFNHIRGQILLMTLFPNINQVYAMIL